MEALNSLGCPMATSALEVPPIQSSGALDESYHGALDIHCGDHTCSIAWLQAAIERDPAKCVSAFGHGANVWSWRTAEGLTSASDLAQFRWLARI